MVQLILFQSTVFSFYVSIFLEKTILINSEPQYLFFGIALISLWLLIVFVVNLYHEKNILSFESFTKATLKAYIYLLLCYHILTGGISNIGYLTTRYCFKPLIVENSFSMFSTVHRYKWKLAIDSILYI